MGLWGLAALGILFCYRPPKRHTKYDHLSLLQKLGRLDLVGSALLTIGLTLFMVGANLGESLYHWTDAVVLAPLVIGIAVVVVFCLYEWKGTATGILHHDLFRGDSTHGRTVAICLLLMAAEGALMFAFIIYYPILYVGGGYPFGGHVLTSLRTTGPPLSSKPTLSVLFRGPCPSGDWLVCRQLCGDTSVPS